MIKLFKVPVFFHELFILFCLQLVCERDTQLSKIYLASYISSYHISCLTILCLCVQDYGCVCVCAAALRCACVLILSERLRFFFAQEGRGGTPWWASVCGPVSLCEWVWIRRLPTRTHGWLSWQSEAHWPVTEIKRRAISATKTTCGMEGTMGSRRGEGEGNGKETRGDVPILTVTCRFGKWRLLSIPAFVVHL